MWRADCCMSSRRALARFNALLAAACRPVALAQPGLSGPTAQVPAAGMPAPALCHAISQTAAKQVSRLRGRLAVAGICNSAAADPKNAQPAGLRSAQHAQRGRNQRHGSQLMAGHQRALSTSATSAATAPAAAVAAAAVPSGAAAASGSAPADGGGPAWRRPSEPQRLWDQPNDKRRLLVYYSDQYRVVSSAALMWAEFWAKSRTHISHSRSLCSISTLAGLWHALRRTKTQKNTQTIAV